METIHLLKVSPETRKTIKEQAIRLHNKGKKEAEIADLLNISYGSFVFQAREDQYDLSD